VGANEKVWTEVGERFTALGHLMKDRYRRQAAGAGPSRDAEDSMRRLADALDEVFTAAGETVRDPAVAEEARRAARSLGEALSATFEDVDDGLRDRFRRAGDHHRYDRKRDDIAND
jgi:hypothetical protein